jgi:hypothetical protein
MNTTQEQTTSALLRKGEAARYLNVSERWLQRNFYKMPHIKMGKSVMFLIPDLDAFIQRNRKAGGSQ